MLHLATYRAVGEVGGKRAAEPVGDVRHNITAAQLVLEDTAAVGVAALLSGEIALRPGLRLHAMHLIYILPGLDAVRAHVLHRARADLAGDVGEIFKSVPAFVHATRHEVVPHHTRAGTHKHAAGVAADRFAAGYEGMQHRPVVVAGEKQIAPRADMQPLSARKAGQKGFKLVGAAVLEEVVTTGVYAEGVMVK